MTETVTVGLEWGGPDTVSGFRLLIASMYIQGYWYDEDWDPGPEVYQKYFHPRLADLISRHRVLHLALQFVRRYNPPHLIILTFSQTFIIQPISIYRIWAKGETDIFENGFNLLSIGLAFVVVLNMYYYRKEYTDVVQRSVLLSQRFLRLIDEARLKSVNNLAHKLILYCHIFILSAFALMVLSFLVYVIPQGIPFARSWLLWDYGTSPIFELVTIFVNLEFSILGLQCFTCAAISLSLGILVGEHYDYVTEILRNLFKLPSERLAKKEKDDLECRNVGNDNLECHDVGTQHEVEGTTDVVASDEEVGWPEGDQSGRLVSVFVISELESPMNSVNTDSPLDQEANNGDRRVEFESAFQEDLKVDASADLKYLVEIHNEMLSIVSTVNKISQAIVIVNYFVCIFLIAAITIVVKNSEAISMKELLMATILLNIYIIYFILNFISTQIEEKNSGLGGALYDCDWTSAPLSFKKSMLIIMARINVPVVIKPTGFDALSIRNFAEVSNSAYKMITSATSIGTK